MFIFKKKGSDTDNFPKKNLEESEKEALTLVIAKAKTLSKKDVKKAVHTELCEISEQRALLWVMSEDLEFKVRLLRPIVSLWSRGILPQVHYNHEIDEAELLREAGLYAYEKIYKGVI